MSNFSEVLKQLRKKHGLTQSDLATKLKISRSAVGMYETGNREPSFEDLEKIADFFNVPIGSLISRETIRIKTDVDVLIDVASGLDQEQIKRLLSYARFLKEEK